MPAGPCGAIRAHGPMPSANMRKCSGSSTCCSKRRRCTASADKKDGPDVITSLWGKVFGEASLNDPEPMGLKRVTDEKAKEWYPAPTDEWAEPVDSDDGEMVAIRQMLKQTSIEKAPLRLAYDAEAHGWNAKAFHERVDTYGAAVVIAATAGGAVIGGYNPSGWIGLGEDRDSMAAFLFTWPDGDVSKRPVKLPKVGGPGLAVLDKPDSGPQFGPDGLRVPLAPGSPQQVFTKLGSYYAKMPGGGKTLLVEGEEAKRGKGSTLQWLRVYVAEGGPEEWELDGIVWKTSKAES